MHYSPALLQRLFDDAAQKAKYTYEHADAESLAIEINEHNPETAVQLNGRYLYETYKKIKTAVQKEEAVIEFSPAFINSLALYLGMRDFGAYKKQMEEETEDNTTSDNYKNQQNGIKIIVGEKVTNIERDMHGDINFH